MLLAMQKLSTKFNNPQDGIGRYMAERLNLQIVDQPTDAPVPDTLFGASGFFGFCNWRADYIKMVCQSQRFVFFCNDYDPGLPSQLRRLPQVEIWTHIVGHDWWKNHNDESKRKRVKYVPWTALTLKTLVPLRQPVYPGAMYYGAVRKRRVPLFEKYLDPRTTVISATPRAQELWLREGYAKLKDPFVASEDIGAYAWTVYMEDPKPDDPRIGGRAITNRFFECLTAGIPMLFTEESVPTLQSFGILPFPIVASKEDIAWAMSTMDRNTVAAEQRQSFLQRDWRRELDIAIDAALKDHR